MTHSNAHPSPNRLAFSTTHASDNFIQLYVVLAPSAQRIAQAICHPVRTIDYLTFNAAGSSLIRILSVSRCVEGTEQARSMCMVSLIACSPTRLTLLLSSTRPGVNLVGYKQNKA